MNVVLSVYCRGQDSSPFANTYLCMVKKKKKKDTVTPAFPCMSFKAATSL